MISINLLPKHRRRRAEPNYWRVGAAAVAVISIGTMVTLHLMVSSTLRGLNKDIAELQSELAVLQPFVNERNQLQSRKNALEAVTSVSQTLKAGQVSWSADLARFVQQMPTGTNAPVVALNSMTMRILEPAARTNLQTNGVYDRKQVTTEFQIAGAARSSEALVQFVNSFEGASQFGVQFQSAQRNDTTGEYSFNVTVGLIGASPTGEIVPQAADPAGEPAAQNASPAPLAAAPSATPGGTR